MSFEFTVKLSNGLYQWLLDGREENYKVIFSNDGPGAGHGMEYCFFFMFGVSLITALIYYFGIASDINNATKKNYLSSWIMGFICLVAINYAGMEVILDGNASVLPSFNMVKICLIDIIYYSVLFEVFSLLFKDHSNASNIHLLTAFK